MKRRNFNRLGACSLTALAAGIGAPEFARAAVSSDQANLLKTTLTPMGSERAGNADGSIPAWTGGVTTVPPGWTQADAVMPDIFADEKPYLTVTAANMAQFKAKLSDGVMALMQKYGFSLNVYPTHRTAAMPQYVYDFTYQNALNSQANPNGARFGFSGAYGGPPFPIPDGDDQGGQIIWNHLTRWAGFYSSQRGSNFNVNSGVATLANTSDIKQKFPYYDPAGTEASFDGVQSLTRINIVGPPPLFGQVIVTRTYTNPLQFPTENWQLLPGQGRVRKAPELQYDTPAPGSSGILNFDEVQGFYGSPIEYEWKCLGKAEMFIPYNSNGQALVAPHDLIQAHFIDPAHVRWELHRVWVVDATLAHGERNVVTHRRFYFDEDCWGVTLVDEYDAQGNLWKVIVCYNTLRPDIPAVIYGGSSTHDMQTDQYSYGGGPSFSDPELGGPLSTAPVPPQTFNPESMAAQAQY